MCGKISFILVLLIALPCYAENFNYCFNCDRKINPDEVSGCGSKGYEVESYQNFLKPTQYLCYWCYGHQIGGRGLPTKYEVKEKIREWKERIKDSEESKKFVVGNIIVNNTDSACRKVLYNLDGKFFLMSTNMNHNEIWKWCTKYELRDYKKAKTSGGMLEAFNCPKCHKLIYAEDKKSENVIAPKVHIFDCHNNDRHIVECPALKS